jgi:predicted ATPase
MFIERLRVTNFRSFRELDLELSPLSVLVGANASGKTNFVQLFRFLRDVAIAGFDVAIVRQGGIEQIRGSHVGKSEPLTIELEGAFAERTLLTYANIKPRRYHYSFTIQFTRGRAGYRVAEERFRVWLEGAEAKQHAATLTRHGNHFEMALPSALFKKVSPEARRTRCPQTRLPATRFCKCFGLSLFRDPSLFSPRSASWGRM